MTSARLPVRRVGGVLAPVLAGLLVAPAHAAVEHDLVRVGPAGERRVTLDARAPVRGIRLEVLSPTCAHGVRLEVRLDGNRVGRPLVGRGIHRPVRLPAHAAAGRHAVGLRVVGGRRACRRATVDELRLLVDRRAATRAPVTARTPAALPPPGPPRAIPLAAAVGWRIAAGTEPALERTFRGNFDGLTPENDLKMAYVMPERRRFDFTYADALVGYAMRHRRTVHGHTLVWHEQLPGWLTRRPLPREEVVAVLRDWIHTVVGRYRGRIGEWDVVNEMLDERGEWRRSVWYRALGEDVVDLAFRFAHEAAPDARLFLNDFDIERPGPKQDATVALVRRLLARGVPIHGVGFQTHWDLSGPPPAEADVQRAFERFAELGLDVQVTEMDVAVDRQADPFGRQALEYAKAARVCQRVARCTRFTVWGVSDRHSWRGPHADPLLFDDAFAPKPAFNAVRSALAAGR